MASRRTIAAFVATAAGIGAIPLVAQQRPASGPVARYDMRAGTISGMGAMGQMNPMAMALGGGRGNQAQHELWLRLGTSRDPNPGAAKADHFMPPVAKLGKSVALGYREERGDYDQLPQRPKGRMLLYWGCGEHAPAGQPVVLDFAKLAAGQMPPGLWSTTIVRDWGPDARNSKTFGQWPWADQRNDYKSVRPDSSLLGAHRVVANYSPEIAFTLSRDFMQPLSARGTAQPSGSTLVSWTGVADATGYHLFLIGGKQAPGGREMENMVMWSSSATRQFGGGLSDWLSPGQVAGLVRDRAVLAPSATSCVIPAEVKRDAPDFRMTTLTAFGPEENFSHPPRPSDPRTPWHLAWTARIRHKSSTSLMDIPGMPDMSGMAAARQQGQQEQQQPEQCKPKKRGLGGLLGGALGVPSGGGC